MKLRRELEVNPGKHYARRNVKRKHARNRAFPTGTPSPKAPCRKTAITGRFSGLRIILLTTPSPRCSSCCLAQEPISYARQADAQTANGKLWRSSPITAAGPRWFCTTFPFSVRPSGHRPSRPIQFSNEATRLLRVPTACIRNSRNHVKFLSFSNWLEHFTFCERTYSEVVSCSLPSLDRPVLREARSSSTRANRITPPPTNVVWEGISPTIQYAQTGTNTGSTMVNNAAK